MNYYFYNTDARAIIESPRPRFATLIEGDFAAVGGDRKQFGEQLNQLDQDDILLMYENRIGVVAIGRVVEPWDQVSHASPKYYTRKEMGTLTGGAHEYRIGVKWVDISDNPIGLPELRNRLGYTPRGTVKKINERRDEVEKLIAERVGDESALLSVWLPDEEADSVESKDASRYSPQDEDRRELVKRQIRERRGQGSFRNALRERYGDRCLVTGCEILAVLEAAHVMPYRGENDNDPENGLLLRTDIHTLFDLDLLGIEPNCLRVELHPNLSKDNEYGIFAGKILDAAAKHRPSQEASRRRYEKFKDRADQPA